MQARSALDNFTNDTDNALLLTGFLLRNVQYDQPDLSAARPDETDIADLFRNNLLNPAAPSFDSVRLLDRNGQVLINSECRPHVVRRTRMIRSRRRTWRFRARSFRSSRRALAVTNGSTPLVEVVNTIFWRDGSPLGYVVVTLNNGRIFFNNMRLDDSADNYLRLHLPDDGAGRPVRAADASASARCRPTSRWASAAR